MAMSPARPRVIFFVETPAQAEDALHVAEQLEEPALWVPLTAAAAERLRNEPLTAGVRVEDHLAWPGRLGKLARLWRSQQVIASHTRTRPFPLFVFGVDSNTLQRVLIRRTRRCGALSLLVQDGYIDENEATRLVRNPKWTSRIFIGLLERSGLMSGPVRYGTGECTHRAVYSAYTRDLLVGWGVAPDTLTVTGSARMDRLWTPRPAPAGRPPIEKPQTILALGVLLQAFLTQPSTVDQVWLRALDELGRALPDYHIILRPHPLEDQRGYARHMTELGLTHFKLDRVTPLAEVLRQCRVLVLQFPSTVLFDAVGQDRPVVYMDLGQPTQRLGRMAEHRQVIRVTQPETLAQAVTEALVPTEDPAVLTRARREFLHYFLGETDGRSAARVAALIRRLIGSGA